MGGFSPGELAKLRTRSPDDNAVRVFLYAQASRAERARPWDASSISSDCVGQGEVRRGRKKTDGPDGMGVPVDAPVKSVQRSRPPTERREMMECTGERRAYTTR